MTDQTPTPDRVEKMFQLISDKTNFAELVERTEWAEIKKRIVLAVNHHEKCGWPATKFIDVHEQDKAIIKALLKAAKGVLDQLHKDDPIVLELLKAIAQAEGKP